MTRFARICTTLLEEFVGMDITRQKLARGADETKPWVEKGARFGHFAKGVIYVLMGVLALQVAFGSGGRLAGTREAAQFVGRQPFGDVLLGLLGLGLLGYALWRCVVGIKDTDHKGGGASGLLKRAGAVISGLVNGALAIALFQMALGNPGRGDGARSWVAKLIDAPFGDIIIGITGLCIVGAGLVQFYLAYSKKFLEPLSLAELSASQRRWVTRLGQLGHAARGVVFPIIGMALIAAARHHAPGETKDMRQALHDIAASPWGLAALGLVGAGFIAFGAFMLVSARYRRCAV
jgi:uncharacterized protein DUF1206